MFRYLLLLMCFFGMQLQAEEVHLNWYTNYQEAVKASKASSKPIILFFTGSDWCGWCKKLDKEVFATKEFVMGAGDKFIFMEIDFPRNTKLPAAITEQNNQLKAKYLINGYPTIIILDPNEQEIGITGYRTGGPQKYIEHLKSLTEDFSKFKEKMARLELENNSGKELKRLYQKAREYGLEKESQTIIEKGVQSDAPHFFLSELYRQQVSKGSIHDQNAKALKAKILSFDPNNEHLAHYQIAVIDFEHQCEKMHTGTCTPDECVAPILSYLNEFGAKDSEHDWRLNMVVSQIYLDKRRYRESLKYAEAAHESAPVKVQPEIASAIQNIQTHLSQ